ncbi:GLPGLI family protein [Mucilaginibacter roseus]|uniref:GLPGLI family protein n=1 Tax=Mucilaginibacter roseus TaxID=1528868 RepID=A0ABS8U8G1_9SPHI|nr:GLPGLI family protein [Mucilaginibacter roseus]MCD8742500.1 GLPGLI family protein [Mucilaginibacter roseus]
MKTIHKKLTTLLVLVVLSISTLYAQNKHFTKSGTIEFEKSANMYALLRKEINKDNETYMANVYDAYKRNNPQFKKLKSTLTFGDNKTLFTPIAEENNPQYWGNRAIVGQNNVVFTDLNTDKTVAQKKVFEETFLLRDSTRRIKWKITSETRNIAGYECRRANALVLDSIYVVAFYTDEIPVSGGPESFCGLPGMILGVALPHDNITWFATRVTETNVPPASLNAPAKGKAVDRKTFMTTVKNAMKDWGEYAQGILKAVML